jgi:hypothetical protein
MYQYSDSSRRQASNVDIDEGESGKWGRPADSSIPPEIARLSGYEGGMHEDLEALLAAEGDRYHGQDFTTVKLETIKASIASLRPYFVTRDQEQKMSVDVLEILPTGESGYKTTKTLKELLSHIHSIVVQTDSEASSKTDSAAAGGDDGDDGDDEPPRYTARHDTLFVY